MSRFNGHLVKFWFIWFQDYGSGPDAQFRKPYEWYILRMLLNYEGD